MTNLLKTYSLHIAVIALVAIFASAGAGVWMWHEKNASLASRTPVNEEAEVTSTIPVVIIDAPKPTSTPAKPKPIIKPVPKPAVKTSDVLSNKEGKIALVKISVGSKVSVGQTLFTLSTSTQTEELKIAKSDLATATIKLAELTKVSSTQNAALEKSLVQAQASVRSAIQKANLAANDAMVKKVYPFVLGPNSINPKLDFSMPGTQENINFPRDFLTVTSLLSTWNAEIATSTFASSAKTLSMASTAEKNLGKVETFLSKIPTLLTQARKADGISAAKYNKYSSDITSARASVATALNNLLKAEAQELAAKNALVKAATAASQTNTTNTQAIKDQQGKIAALQAKMKALNDSINGAVIVSPYAGTISKILVTPNTMVASGTLVAVISNP
jgi:multidrug efflux pump subunit AcrA (membrane-fusion protein)